MIYFRDENKKINDSPRSSSPPPRGLTECNPEFRNNSERSELPQTAAPPKSSTMDDMSEIKPGILEMIQEEQRVSPLKSNSVVRAFLKFIFHILKIHYWVFKSLIILDAPKMLLCIVI